MRVFLGFLGYFLAAFGLAIAVVPTLQPWLFAPLGLPPESALYRFAMLAALFGMPFFLRLLALNSWAAAGYRLPRDQAWSAVAKGLLVGCAILIALTAAQWLLDVRHIALYGDKASPAYFARTLVSGVLAGLAVGLIEETLFRGLMHTGMRRSLGFWPTALATGALYAALHFMKPEPPGDEAFTMSTALQMATAGIARVGDFPEIADSFGTLLVLGVFLSMVRERTGNVLRAVGIHAGLVAMIKLTKYLTDPTAHEGRFSPWLGSYDYITGWMATLWLCTIATVYWVYSARRRTPRSDDGSSAHSRATQ